jgi:hypothetical protein
MANVDPNTPIRWKKLGGGSLRLKNRIIKPGQVFFATPAEISRGFRDVVVPLDGVDPDVKPQSEPVKVDIVKTEYMVVPKGNSGTWFDVVHLAGKDEKGEPIYKAINEKGLRKEVAEKLKADLER